MKKTILRLVMLGFLFGSVFCYPEGLELKKSGTGVLTLSDGVETKEFKYRTDGKNVIIDQEAVNLLIAAGVNEAAALEYADEVIKELAKKIDKSCI